jgi:hypothetical protein
MFGDREAGARELARVLAPGAPFALALWSGVDDNPYGRLGLRTLERIPGALDGGPDFPAMFRELGSTSTVTSWLADAGMRRVETAWFEWGAEFPDVEAACDYLMTVGGLFTRFYAALTDEQRDAARAVQRELILEQETRSGSAVSLRSRCRIVSGAR